MFNSPYHCLRCIEQHLCNRQGILLRVMSIYKSIVNNTDREVVVTLHIGCAQKAGSFGTRRLELQPGETREVEVGDLQHSFLDGISVTTEVNGIIIRHEQRVQGSDSNFSRQLNYSCGLEIGDLMPLRLKAF